MLIHIRNIFDVNFPIKIKYDKLLQYNKKYNWELIVIFNYKPSFDCDIEFENDSSYGLLLLLL